MYLSSAAFSLGPPINLVIPHCASTGVFAAALSIPQAVWSGLRPLSYDYPYKVLLYSVQSTGGQILSKGGEGPSPDV